MTEKRKPWDSDRMMAYHRSVLAELLDGPRAGWRGWVNHTYYSQKGYITINVQAGDTYETAKYSLTDKGRAFVQGETDG